jgi:hypothetical protein
MNPTNEAKEKFAQAQAGTANGNIGSGSGLDSTANGNSFGNIGSGSGLGSMGNQMPKPEAPGLRETVANDLARTERALADAEKRANTLRELNYLLNKHSYVARIFDLIERV